MSYSLATLWHDRPRYLPAVVAVAFSAVLMSLQSGMVLGVLSIVSLPVDHSSADIWIGAPEVKSVDVGSPIPVRWAARLNLPAVVAQEEYVQGGAFWHRASGGSELTTVHGSRLYPGAFGAAAELTPELRSRLSEPGAVVVDQSDLAVLGLSGDGPNGEVNGRRVRVVGTIRGAKGLIGANLFCSLDTARYLLRMPPQQTTYLLAKCRDPADAADVAARLRQYGDMAVFTKAEFSASTHWHWLLQTGAGIVVGLTTALGILVGVAVTSQTLFAATVASVREFAVLSALGIPRWRMAAAVLTQSFWIGLAGLALAAPVMYSLQTIAEACGAKVILATGVLCAAAVGTQVTAMLSGVGALRALKLAEPATLLR
jgi:putative ABC transport system permease protein